MRLSLWRGVRFAWGNLFATLGLALLVVLVGAIGLGVYVPSSRWLGGPTPALVVMLVLLQQLYIVWRIGLRLTRYAGEVQLYRALSPTTAAPGPVPVLEAEAQ